MAHGIPARLNELYTADAGRRFGATVGGAFIVLAAIAHWRGHPTTFFVFSAVGVLLIAAAALAPAALGPIDRTWMAVAGFISKLTTPVFMGLIYFVIITPIGLVRHIFGGGSLTHRAGANGFWVDRRGSPRGDLERQF